MIDFYAGKEFGIVANVLEPDRIFRIGAKVWLCGGTGGEGWHRFRWSGLARSPRRLEKWAPTLRFHNFRAAWVPEGLRGSVTYMRGTRPEMEEIAREMEVFAAEQRALHPGRIIGKPEPQQDAVGP